MIVFQIFSISRRNYCTNMRTRKALLCAIFWDRFPSGRAKYLQGRQLCPRRKLFSDLAAKFEVYIDRGLYWISRQVSA